MKTFHLAALAALTGLAACAEPGPGNGPAGVAPINYSKATLERQHEMTIYCVSRAFTEMGGDRSSEAAARPTIAAAVAKCDPIIVEHANALASKGLHANNWSHYDPPIPQWTADQIRADLNRLMPAVVIGTGL